MQTFYPAVVITTRFTYLILILVLYLSINISSDSFLSRHWLNRLLFLMQALFQSILFSLFVLSVFLIHSAEKALIESAEKALIESDNAHFFRELFAL